MENIVNLTPHPLTLYGEKGEEIATIPASGEVARVSTIAAETGREVLGAPVVSQRPGPVTGLPDPEEGTTYVVSLFVRQALEGRPDVVAPDTGPESAVRDGAGRIMGIRRWIGL